MSVFLKPSDLIFVKYKQRKKWEKKNYQLPTTSSMGSWNFENFEKDEKK